MNTEDSGAAAGAATSRKPSERIRIGIIGCGAITERAHLPAVLSASRVELTALSDTNEVRLRNLQHQFGLGNIGFNDYRDIFGRVDAVILALPNALHALVGVEFLSRGIHVLCEKPLAASYGESILLCEAARATSSVLAVGFVTRFFPSTNLTKELLESRFLGALRSFNYEFGTAGGWAPVSGYNLTRPTSGGGVLVVSGSHFIDRMLYLFGNVDVISYSDDSRGGVEANCMARFLANLQGQPLQGCVTLSKTHTLSNRLCITGEYGTLEIGEGQAHSVTYWPAQNRLRHEITCAGMNKDIEPNYFERQLDNFVHAIRTGTSPKVDGEQGAKSVAIMERCYNIATPIDEPWCHATLECLKAAMPPLTAGEVPLPLSLSRRG